MVTDIGTRARSLVESVEDPELPYVTIGDLGMVRDVQADGTQIMVKLTPTYTGCPATEQIRDDVCTALTDAGYEAEVSFVLTPPWTTDWITEVGREKLTKAGIAPPHEAGDGHETRLDLPVACPRCGSRHTKRYGEFGSTACKTNFVCQSCREPFELFKAL